MDRSKQGVSDDQRQQVIDLRRQHSFRDVAKITGIPLGTVKTIVSRSGAFRDNEAHRSLFCLPPMQLSAEQLPAVQDLPPQQAVTGDRDVDALLWLREVIGTGQPSHIEAAMEAAKKIKTPLKQLEERYRAWLQAMHPNNLFAALSSFESDIEIRHNRGCEGDKKYYPFFPEGWQSKPAQQMISTRVNFEAPSSALTIAALIEIALDKNRKNLNQTSLKLEIAGRNKGIKGLSESNLNQIFSSSNTLLEAARKAINAD